MYVILSECKHGTQVSKEIKVKYSMQLVVMVVVVVVVVMQDGGRVWGDGDGGGRSGGGEGDTIRHSALCLLLNKIYPNIAENDLQLVIDIKLCVGLLPIEF